MPQTLLCCANTPLKDDHSPSFANLWQITSAVKDVLTAVTLHPREEERTPGKDVAMPSWLFCFAIQNCTGMLLMRENTSPASPQRTCSFLASPQPSALVFLESWREKRSHLGVDSALIAAIRTPQIILPRKPANPLVCLHGLPPAQDRSC